jgi:hypothetical protein
LPGLLHASQGPIVHGRASGPIPAPLLVGAEAGIAAPAELLSPAPASPTLILSAGVVHRPLLASAALALAVHGALHARPRLFQAVQSLPRLGAALALVAASTLTLALAGHLANFVHLVAEAVGHLRRHSFARPHL